MTSQSEMRCCFSTDVGILPVVWWVLFILHITWGAEMIGSAGLML